MSDAALGPVRRLTLDIRPEESWSGFGLTTRVRIDVQTDSSAYSLNETLATHEFHEQLQEIMARLGREVVAHCTDQAPFPDF